MSHHPWLSAALLAAAASLGVACTSSRDPDAGRAQLTGTSTISNVAPELDIARVPPSTVEASTTVSPPTSALPAKDVHDYTFSVYGELVIMSASADAYTSELVDQFIEQYCSTIAGTLTFDQFNNPHCRFDNDTRWIWFRSSNLAFCDRLLEWAAEFHPECAGVPRVAE